MVRDYKYLYRLRTGRARERRAASHFDSPPDTDTGWKLGNGREGDDEWWSVLFVTVYYINSN